MNSIMVRSRMVTKNCFCGVFCMSQIYMNFIILVFVIRGLCENNTFIGRKSNILFNNFDFLVIFNYYYNPLNPLMMKQFYPIVSFLIVFSFFTNYLGAQCPAPIPLDFQSVPMESICEANGTITITPTGGTPFMDINGGLIYANAIIAGPVLYPAQSELTFDALSPGDYTVEVADACGTIVTASVTVPGTYVIPDLNFVVSDAVCTGLPSGEISVQPFDGLAPYGYRLIYLNVMPPDTIGIQMDSIFPNLLAGDYRIQIFDQCNNFQTRDATLQDVTYGNLDPFNQQLGKWGCDSFALRLDLFSSGRGLAPYTWEILAAPGEPGLVGTTGVLEDDFDTDTLIYANSSSFTVSITDACGTSRTETTPAWGGYAVLSSIGYDCVDGAFLSVNLNNPEPCVPTTYEIISGPITVPSQSDPTFNNLPEGTYVFQATDCCGETVTGTKTVVAPSWTSTGSFLDNVGCILGVFDLRFFLNANGGPAATSPYTHTLYEAPVGVPVPQSVTGSTRFEDLPTGYYCWFSEDACGRRDSSCRDFTSGFEFELDIIVDIECITGSSIEASYTSNSLDIEFRFQELGIPGYIQNHDPNNIWVNLTSGTYVVTSTNKSTSCPIRMDTVEVPEYVQPSLDALWGIQCDGGAGLITGLAAGGIEPYTYEIIAGPVLKPLQSSPIFSGLPVGTYDVRVFDDCNNSFINTVSIEPFAPIIQGYAPPACLSQELTMYVDSVAGATYTWSGPNNFTATGAQVTIPSVDASDAGQYSVAVEIIGCATATATIDVATDPCLLSYELISFSAQLANRQDVLLSWKVTGQEDISFFEIERSTNGIDFNSIGKIDSDLNLQSYSYLDDRVTALATFYRVKIQELDGTITYTEIQLVQLPEIDNITMYPTFVVAGTPIKGHTVENYENIFVYDTSGRLVNTIALSDELVKEFIIPTNQLSDGLYIARFNSKKLGKSRTFVVVR